MQRLDTLQYRRSIVGDDDFALLRLDLGSYLSMCILLNALARTILSIPLGPKDVRTASDIAVVNYVSFRTSTEWLNLYLLLPPCWTVGLPLACPARRVYFTSRMCVRGVHTLSLKALLLPDTLDAVVVAGTADLAAIVKSQ